MLKKSTIVLSSCNILRGLCGPVSLLSSTSSYLPHKSLPQRLPLLSRKERLRTYATAVCRRARYLHETPLWLDATSLNASLSVTLTCLSPVRLTQRNTLTRLQYKYCRRYAVVADGNVRNHHENLPWPEVTSLNSIPTPYQIFSQKKGSRYSKQRFYELVKLYHPDRHNHDDVGISISTKLERYRLVIAANDILSDPVKRGAYNTYGAGWNGMPDVMAPRDATGGNQAWGNYSGRGWGGGPGGPSQNATWEDWERWYQRDSGTKPKQSPLFFSNTAFVTLIVMFAALGGVGQATRAGNYSMTFLEQRNALHDKMSKDLIRRKRESVQHNNHDVRIQNFLKQRDSYGYGVTDPKEEQYRKLLPDPEICSSADIRERRMDLYHRKDESDKK